MKRCCVALAVLLSPLVCSGQVLTVKPGLWEHQLDLKSESGRLEAALDEARRMLALLPPAQRQMMEGMLVRQGIRFDIVNQSFRNCVSEEEAASGRFRFVEQNGCELSQVRNEGSDSHISFVCPEGQGSLVLRDGSTYTGSSSMTLDFNGVVEKATATHSGRWLGASCAALP